MDKLRNILVAFVIFGLVGCATSQPPPPKPLDPQRAVIGISVKMRAPIKAFTDQADQVYFIKVDKEEGLFNQQNIIQSNYAKGGQVYLLNAKPGQYAAVAVAKSKTIPTIPSSSAPSSSGVTVTFTPPSENKYTAFLSKRIIKLTEVIVTPESMTFMGKYVVDESLDFKDADDAQLHYIQLLAPGAKTDVLSMGFSGKSYYTGSLHEENCDKQTEIKFLTKALEHFKDTDWTNTIQKRIAELKAGK